jgi:hypothetical protein
MSNPFADIIQGPLSAEKALRFISVSGISVSVPVKRGLGVFSGHEIQYVG